MLARLTVYCASEQGLTDWGILYFLGEITMLESVPYAGRGDLAPSRPLIFQTDPQGWPFYLRRYDPADSDFRLLLGNELDELRGCGLAGRAPGLYRQVQAACQLYTIEFDWEADEQHWQLGFSFARFIALRCRGIIADGIRFYDAGLNIIGAYCEPEDFDRQLDSLARSDTWTSG